MIKNLQNRQVKIVILTVTVNPKHTLLITIKSIQNHSVSKEFTSSLSKISEAQERISLKFKLLTIKTL